MALSSLDKLAENIEGRILDAWIDLDGVEIIDQADSSDTTADEIRVPYDKTGQIDTSQDVEWDSTGDGALDSSSGISSVSYDSANDQTVIALSSSISTNIGGNIVAYTGSDWQPMGNMQDITVQHSPVNQDADVANRQKQIALDADVTLVMQQTTNREFRALEGLVTPNAAGHTIKLVDRLVAQADVDTADGFGFENVLPSFEGEFDGSGEGSTFTVNFGGRVLIGQLDTYNGTLTFDV